MKSITGLEDRAAPFQHPNEASCHSHTHTQKKSDGSYCVKFEKGELGAPCGGGSFNGPFQRDVRGGRPVSNPGTL